jgi:hypothetical protein
MMEYLEGHYDGWQECLHLCSRTGEHFPETPPFPPRHTNRRWNEDGFNAGFQECLAQVRLAKESASSNEDVRSLCREAYRPKEYRDAGVTTERQPVEK